MSEAQDFRAAHLEKNLAPELLFAALPLRILRLQVTRTSLFEVKQTKAQSTQQLEFGRSSKPFETDRSNTLVFLIWTPQINKSTWVNKCQQHLMLASPKIMAYMAVVLACLKLIPHKYHSNGLRAGSQEYVLAKPKVNATPPKKRKARCLSPA